MNTYEGIPLIEFDTNAALRSWLVKNHAASSGIWVRVYKTASEHTSVTFLELLDQGLCFGWSESLRRAGDSESYYQKFTPRRIRGTTSKRNLAHVKYLIASGEMTAAGLWALKLDD